MFGAEKISTIPRQSGTDWWIAKMNTTLGAPIVKIREVSREVALGPTKTVFGFEGGVFMEFGIYYRSRGETSRLESEPAPDSQIAFIEPANHDRVKT